MGGFGVLEMKEDYDIYHVGISGGKDSTAALLWATRESGWDHNRIRATFCDTGNEHRITYDYLAMLSETVFPIQVIEPPLDFYALAEKKGRFPSVKARFCTQQLKIFPSQAYIKAYQIIGLELLLVSGVRRAESKARSELPEFEFDTYYLADSYRPLIDWSTEDVYAYLSKHNLPRNPLYDYGAQRVGCFPCFMSSKQEMRTIAKHFPERIDMIREAEKRVGKERGSTFFARDKTPEEFRSKPFETEDGEIIYVPTIDDVAAWSKTAYRKRGGQYEMDFDDPPTVCNSNLGACE